ncbi:MAG: Fe-S-containing protein [Gemmiger sp.]
MKKNARHSSGRSFLPFVAAAVMAVALLVTLMTTRQPATAAENTGAVAAQSPGSDLLIRAEEIGAEASYFDYDAEDGVTVQVLAVRASDNTVRVALNTCQVCNGSPYAFFEQEGDVFICQNCKNRFSSLEVGRVSGGCNPVPITEDVYTEQEGVITVPASFLEENAVRFVQWKKF